MKEQTTTLDSEKWEEWQGCLGRIEQELRRLYFARGMFERLNSLANNSNNLKKCPSDLFFVWLWNCYIVYLGMGVRRLIDKRSNEKNLYQLLKDFKKDDAHQLSVDNYAEDMFKKCHEARIKNCQDKTNSEKGFLRESYRKKPAKRLVVFSKKL